MNNKKTYSAPSKKSAQFKKYWKKFIPKVIERENFHEAHLESLSILCDLYVEYHKLSEFINKQGYTYETDGRYGLSFTKYPEVDIRQKTIAEIRQYSNMLGLKLEKDRGSQDPDDFSEWQ